MVLYNNLKDTIYIEYICFLFSGGLYFIISRSIGPEFGASIGILLAFANTISAAMNTIGFCTSLRLLLQTYDVEIINDNFNFRFLGVICIILMSITCCIGMDREAEVCLPYAIYK